MSSARQNRRVAFLAAALAGSMLGLAYASVPLYRIFCQVTGYGGTTQVADAAPGEVAERTISIRFDANTASGLGWGFHPVETTVDVKIGEEKLAFYRAVNTTSSELTGTAVFNVSPPQAGAYFNKIECFCFKEQTLAAGQSVDMPVVFFVDPEFLKDPDTASISEITLSYTFYRAGDPQSLSGAVAPVPEIN